MNHLTPGGGQRPNFPLILPPDSLFCQSSNPVAPSGIKMPEQIAPLMGKMAQERPIQPLFCVQNSESPAVLQ